MIRLAAFTHVGKVRGENQDAFIIAEPADGGVRGSRGVLLAVADGMGGLEEGRTASQLAVKSLEEHYFQSELEPSVALMHAVEAANNAIHEYAIGREQALVMGSTLTALAVVGGRAWIAQVGDSRAYLYQRGVLRQVTKDHSLVRELADRGHIQPGSEFYSMHRNVLTRGLGLELRVDVDLYALTDLGDGDVFLVSSDGLHELLTVEDMAESIALYGPRIEKLSEHLVALAVSRGGPDNATVGVARIDEPAGVTTEATLPARAQALAHEAPPARAEASRSSRRRAIVVVLAASVLSFCAALALTWPFRPVVRGFPPPSNAELASAPLTLALYVTRPAAGGSRRSWSLSVNSAGDAETTAQTAAGPVRQRATLAPLELERLRELLARDGFLSDGASVLGDGGHELGERTLSVTLGARTRTVTVRDFGALLRHRVRNRPRFVAAAPVLRVLGLVSGWAVPALAGTEHASFLGFAQSDAAVLEAAVLEAVPSRGK